MYLQFLFSILLSISFCSHHLNFLCPFSTLVQYYNIRFYFQTKVGVSSKLFIVLFFLALSFFTLRPFSIFPASLPNTVTHRCTASCSSRRLDLLNNDDKLLHVLHAVAAAAAALHILHHTTSQFTLN